MTVDLRPIEPAEFPTFFRNMADTFGGDVRDSDREMERGVFEFDRSIAGFDGTDLVSTTAAFSRRITVPGGVSPVAAVTMVTVAPTHRRQGVLTSMMRRQLTDVHEQQREPFAALWASESSIYGRFGYGLGTNQAHATGRIREIGAPPQQPGRMRRSSIEEARPTLISLHEQVRPANVGWLDRPGKWWDTELYDPEHDRNGATALRCALYDAPDGETTGYVLYRIKHSWDDDGSTSEVRIKELLARDAQAHAALWRYVLSLDLIRRFTIGRMGIDDPVRHIVPNARGVRLQVGDGLWVRLVDLGRALAARTYSVDVDLVFEVADEFLPWNAGRWRLSGSPKGAVCEPTADPADISLSSTELGAAFLGGTSIATLAAAGRVQAQRPGALEQANLAFSTDRAPWCPDGF